MMCNFHEIVCYTCVETFIFAHLINTYIIIWANPRILSKLLIQPMRRYMFVEVMFLSVHFLCNTFLFRCKHLNMFIRCNCMMWTQLQVWQNLIFNCSMSSHAMFSQHKCLSVTSLHLGWRLCFCFRELRTTRSR